jgi:hypothetical protein
VAALVLGGFRIAAAQDTSAAAGRIEQLSTVGSDMTSLAEAMEDERDLTAGYVATRQAGNTQLAATLLGQLQRAYGVTNARLTTMQAAAGQIGPAYPVVARNDLAAALSSVNALTELRLLAHSEMAPLPLIGHYSNVIATLLEFDNDIAAGSSSATLAQTVTSLATLAGLEEQASQQRAILYASLFTGSFQPGALTALTAAQSSEASDLASYLKLVANLNAFVPGVGLAPSLSQTEQFNNTVTGPDNDAALAIEQDAIISAGSQASQQISGVKQGTPQAWFTDMSFTLGAMRTVETDELGSVQAQAASLRQGAANSRELTAMIVLALLVLVLIVTIVMARSLIMPLRRLRSDALDVAGTRLPDMVRRLSASQGTEEPIEIEPIGVNSTDEIGEVARAFDQVYSEAVRLAGDEALLRANLNAMFVNLSRRSQTLVERQLDIIDTLEQSEQDPDRLSSLFRLDHLATRMRRNSENLLVLAGHEDPRKWSQSVALVDVLRAAISEIEQYDRITLNVQPGIVITGRAASDVVHLAAELLENAAAFSSEDTQVTVVGQLLTSGGALVEITDEGLGIAEQELEYANWRLDNPPVIDVGVSRRMGLFVVGRLAARHGIRVRLRQVPRGGLSALIWVPGPIAEFQTTPPIAAIRKQPENRFHPFFRPAHRPTPAVPAQSATARRATLAGQPALPGISPTAPLQQPVMPAQQPTTPPQPGTLPIRTPQPVQTAFDPTQPALANHPVPTTQAQPVLPVRTPYAPQPVDPVLAAPGHPSNPRLPIYDSVESDWFRHSGKSVVPSSRAATGSWTSPADEGFRAAQAAAAPTTGEATAAGLPRRVPSANLIPGSVGGPPTGPLRIPGGTPSGGFSVPSGGAPGGQEAGQFAVARASTGGWPASRDAAADPPPPPPVGRPRRPAEEVRNRLADMQRGSRQGRTEAPWNYGADES